MYERFLAGRRVLYDKDGGGGSGSGAGNEGDGDGNGGSNEGEGAGGYQVPVERLPADVVDAMFKRAKKEGDFESFAATLYNDNKKQRDRLNELQKKQVPAGAVVLKGEEAKRYERYKELGDPDEIKKNQSELQSLRKKDTERERADRRKAAAKTAGFVPSVVERLGKTDGVDFDVIEGEKDEDGNAKKVAVVLVPAEEEDAEPEQIALEKYAEENWSDFMAVLKTDGDEGPQQASSASGKRVLKGAPSNSGAKKNDKPASAAKKLAKRRYSVKNDE